MITDDPRLTAMGLLAETFAGLQASSRRHSPRTVSRRSSSRCSCGSPRSPGCRLRMNDLAAQADLSTSGVTRVVDRLERSGEVRRETCPSDRRGSFAVLTDEGADAYRMWCQTTWLILTDGSPVPSAPASFPDSSTPCRRSGTAYVRGPQQVQRPGSHGNDVSGSAGAGDDTAGEVSSNG